MIKPHLVEVLTSKTYPTAISFSVEKSGGPNLSTIVSRRVAAIRKIAFGPSPNCALGHLGEKFGTMTQPTRHARTIGIMYFKSNVSVPSFPISNLLGAVLRAVVEVNDEIAVSPHGRHARGPTTDSSIKLGVTAGRFGGTGLGILTRLSHRNVFGAKTPCRHRRWRTTSCRL